MKAAIIRKYGKPDVVEIADVAVPTIGPDEVLIRVAASSFNPADAAIRSGALQSFIPVTFPHTLGADAAGLVEQVGAEVTTLKIGDPVFAYIDFAHRGGQAEFVAAKAAEVAPAPKSLPLVDAAVLPAVGLTAWQALFEHGGLEAGQRVVVLGASGGVGSMAVQLAKWKGAHVIGVASAKQESFLRDLGIDQFIDYSGHAVSDEIGEPVDLIFNASSASAEQVTALFPTLRPGGILVSAAAPADENGAKAQGVRTVRLASRRDGQQLQTLAQLVDEGSLRPIIADRRALAEVGTVHAEGNVPRGKLAIIVDETIGR